MKRKITIGGAVTLALMLATVTFIMTMIYAQNSFDSRVYNIKERETMYAKLAEVDQLVRRDFYTEIDEDVLMDGLIDGYLDGLGDANARYQTAEKYKEELNAAQGRTVGIGAAFSQDASGYIRITEIAPESPAELMELAVGDLITKVDDLAVTSDNYEQAVAAISGEAGTTVTLVIHHDSIEKISTITRRQVEIKTVSVTMFDTIAHIDISEFGESTPSEFSMQLATLFNSGVTGLVIDLRDVKGGSIESMLDMADRIVPSGVLLSATYRGGTTEVIRNSNDSEVDLPISVLINQNTSGAGELFAQILRDYKKASLVGNDTAGRCSMTDTLLLSDGSAVTITIAVYNPPVSPSFEGEGVNPDFDVAMSVSLDTLGPVPDPTNDAQLKKAIEAVGGTVQYEEPVVEEPVSEAEGEEKSSESSESSESGEES